jgi:hypothetical protein
VQKEWSAALSSYDAEITKAPEWTSAWQILDAYQLTGKDVPSEVTATDKHTEYTTTPDWYVAFFSPPSHCQYGFTVLSSPTCSDRLHAYQQPN